MAKPRTDSELREAATKVPCETGGAPPRDGVESAQKLADERKHKTMTPIHVLVCLLALSADQLAARERTGRSATRGRGREHPAATSGSNRSHRCYAREMAKMVKVSVSVEKEKLRLAKEQAKREGISLSAIVTRGLQHELDARARLEAALELYGPDGWPTPEERRKVIASWTKRTTKPRVKRPAAAA